MRNYALFVARGSQIKKNFIKLGLGISTIFLFLVDSAFAGNLEIAAEQKSQAVVPAAFCENAQKIFTQNYIEHPHPVEPEVALGTLCDYGQMVCSELPPDLKALPLNELLQKKITHSQLDELHLNSAAVSVFESDLNGDSLPDLRIEQVSGTLGCQRNYFFLKQADGSYRHDTIEELANLEGAEGAFCSQDFLAVAQIEGKNYLVVKSSWGRHVYMVERRGKVKELCFVPEGGDWSVQERKLVLAIKKQFPFIPEEVTFSRPELWHSELPKGFRPPGLIGQYWRVFAVCSHYSWYAMFWIDDEGHVVPAGGQPPSSSCKAKGVD